VPRERLTFRQRDLKAALKAAQDVGMSVARIEVRKDGIVIVPGEPVPEPVPDTDPENDAIKEAIRNEALQKHVPPDKR
jgi:hypothetical protein